MPPTFTTLPFEIRNDIYDHVFGNALPTIHVESADTFVGMNCVASGITGEEWHQQSRLGLLLVNHQISDEAAAVGYRKIKIFSTNRQTANAFCRIGARYLRFIQVVDFCFMEVVQEVVEDACRAFEVLNTLPNLRRIYVLVRPKEIPILQDALDQGSVKDLAGRCDIRVCDVWKRLTRDGTWSINRETIRLTKKLNRTDYSKLRDVRRV